MSRIQQAEVLVPDQQVEAGLLLHSEAREEYAWHSGDSHRAPVTLLLSCDLKWSSSPNRTPLRMELLPEPVLGGKSVQHQVDRALTDRNALRMSLPELSDQLRREQVSDSPRMWRLSDLRHCLS